MNAAPLLLLVALLADAPPRAFGELAAPGVPGPLCVFGKKAMVTAVGGVGDRVSAAVAAAGRLGRGRVVAFGHGGYLHRGALAHRQTAGFLRDSVAWAAGDGRAYSCFHYKLPAAAAAVGAVGEWDGTEIPKGCDVLLADASVLNDAARFQRIERFVRSGGGFVTASLGWGWKQLNPGRDLLVDHAGNRLLRHAGIVWADGYLQRTSTRGYRQPTRIDAALHARDALVAGAASPQAARTLTMAVHAIPHDDKLFRPRFESALRGISLEGRRVIKADDGLARVAFAWTIAEANRRPPEKVRPHAWALRFPGSVSHTAPRVTRRLTIDTKVPRWHSTGLYAAPGGVVTLRGKANGLFARVGAHTDRLWQKKTWNRAPQIARRWALSDGETRIANAFGGHVYIEVPAGARKGVRAIEISGAVEAPWFVLGKTDLKEWRRRIRTRAAPWAELGTDRLIVTLPSRAIRQLDDPRPLLQFWDEVMDACADLAAKPRDRASPERIVCDKQISVGYMHAGYPIMTHLDQEGWLADEKRLRNGNWGLFHEIGHNHQSGDWTFSGTTEVTVNLFTLYVLDTVCKVERPRANQYGSKRDQRIRDYIARNRKFSNWKKKPFLALLMYQQLQEDFGWDAFKQVFRQYQGAKRPKSDDEKRDLWMVRFSRHVKRNLGPFFEAWGVPTSEAARKSIADLPVWMPDDWPE